MQKSNHGLLTRPHEPEGSCWRIEGTVENGGTDDTLYLYCREKRDTVATLYIKDGKIIPQEGTAAHGEFCQLFFSGSRRSVMGRGFFLDYNTIHIDLQREPDSLKSIQGGMHNRDYSNFLDALSFYKVHDATLTDYREFAKQMYEGATRIVSKYPDHPVSGKVIEKGFSHLRPDQVLSLIDSVSDRMRLTNTISLVEEQSSLRLGSEEGDMFKDMAGATLQGDSIHLSDFVNEGRPVLIEFFGPSCPSCSQSMPMAQEIYDQYKDKGLIVLGVSNAMEDKGKVHAFLDQYSITFPQMLGCKAMSVYGAVWIPDFVFIGPDGKIAFPRNAPITTLRPFLEEMYSDRPLEHDQKIEIK